MSSAKKNLDKMYNEILSYIDKIENPEIKKIMNDIIADKKISKKFKIHPAAVKYHHNWTGGLLQHTLETLKYCELSWNIFPELDKNLLIAGSILHDIGKLQEFEVTTRIKFNDKGNLMGHSFLGAVFLSKKLEKYDIDENIKNKLLHIIISHMGKLEYGAAKIPLFPEAVVVHLADQMSAKVTQITEVVKDLKQNTEDEYAYSDILRYRVFLK